MRSDVLAHFPDAKLNGTGWSARCPAHDDRTASLSLSHGEDGRWLLHCHAGCAFDAILEAAHLTRADVSPPRTTKASIVVATYPYHDERGTHLYDVVRFAPKTFRQRRADGAWTMKGVQRVLYRLPELSGHSTVFIVEGEKDCDRLVALGFTATTNPGGAGKWRETYTQQLQAAGTPAIVVLPDNDDPGRQHVQQVAASCQAAGLPVTIVTLPDLPLKGDVSDYLATHTKDDLLALVMHAQRVGRAEASIDLAQLLTDVERFIRTYVVISEHEAVLAALWTAHTHALAATDYTPYIHLTSPEPECGKSRFVEVVQSLVARPEKADSITRAALIRVMQQQPTLLLDELDSLFRNPELCDTLIGILNAGFHRRGTHLMCVGEGSRQELKKFSVFGPKVLSGIGTLPRPLLTRTIPIQFKRRLKQEAITKWRDARGREAAAPLRRALADWASRAIAFLRSAQPAMPDGLRDRAEDVLEPLFSIADMAGQTWAQRARTAAVALLGIQAVEDDSIGVQLLADCREVFDAATTPDGSGPAEALFSKSLREALHALEDRPWSSWSKAKKPITGQTIARLLRPFGVLPEMGTIRIGERTGKGYRRAPFADAWSRYLPLPVTIESSHRHTPNETGPESPKFEPSHAADVTVAKSPLSSITMGVCDGVTVQNGDQEKKPGDGAWLDI